MLCLGCELGEETLNGSLDSLRLGHIQKGKRKKKGGCYGLQRFEKDWYFYA